MRAIGTAFAIGLAACSSPKTKQPAELGDCVPAPGATCATPVAVGGSSSMGNPDSSAATPDGSAAGAGACSDAGSLVVTMNTMCQPCIVMNCCNNQNCFGDCALLLQRAQACLGDTTCLGVSETTYPNGIIAYRDFANCLASSCTPACPALPQLP